MGGAPTLCHAECMHENSGQQLIAQYQDTWRRLQAAAAHAGELPRRVAPEVMACALVERGETVAVDFDQLPVLLGWLRAVAASHPRHRRPARPALPMRRPAAVARPRDDPGADAPVAPYAEAVVALAAGLHVGEPLAWLVTPGDMARVLHANGAPVADPREVTALVDWLDEVDRATDRQRRWGRLRTFLARHLWPG